MNNQKPKGSVSLAKIILAILIPFLFKNIVHSQIKITYPSERIIIQRNNSNEATIYLGGYFTQPIDRVEARLVPVLTGQGQITDWTLIQNNPSNGVYFGNLKGQGGWYSLEVRGSLKNVIIGRDFVSRVGVGEVFVIAGQSNAEGINGYGSVAPADERVNTVLYNNRTQGSVSDPSNISIGPITAEGGIGPRGRSAWCWGALGDLLVKRLNVPVLFMNVGWESTPIKQWLDSANGLTTKNIFTGESFPPGQPYANLRMALKYYCSVLGVRSVLWVQGETDNYLRISKAEYQSNLQGLINAARSDQGSSLYVPWILSRSSRIDIGVSQDIIDGQNGVIASSFNKVYGGPFTDQIQVPRPDGVHFKNEGLIAAARAWDEIMVPTFFANIVPITPKAAYPITVTCNSNNSTLNLKAPDGFRVYSWSNGQTTQTITVSGVGTYQVVMKDAEGNTIYTPPLTLTEAVQPPAPVITPSGEQYICADSSITLRVNVSAQNTVTWSNGTVGNSITVKNPATFTAKIANVFGCASGTSAPVTIKNLTVKAPTLSSLGRYNLQVIPDSTIFKLPDTRVSNVVWEWKLNGKDYPASTDVIKATQDGDYSVRSKITFDAVSGGSSRSCYSSFSKVLTGYKTAADEGMILYPNPNKSGLLTLETLRDLSNVEVTVISLNGQLVYSQKFAALNERKILVLTSLPEGQYIVRLTSTGFNQTKKILIEY